MAYRQPAFRLVATASYPAVAVDLLRDQGPLLMEDGELVEVPFDGVLVVEGCVHFHERSAHYRPKTALYGLDHFFRAKRLFESSNDPKLISQIPQI